MTDIVFHFNVPDRLAYASRLAHQAFRREVKLTITASEGELAELDDRLWSLAPSDFVAHCRAPQAHAALLVASRIILCADPRLGLPEGVLLNLGAQLPTGFEQFQRVVEVVSLDEGDRVQARLRWKQYADAGHAISRHDAAAGIGRR